LYRDILAGPGGPGARAGQPSKRARGQAGPVKPLRKPPARGPSLQELGAAIRFSTKLPPRIREMAILVVAQATGSGYEQASHELIGRDAGLTEPELDALREGENPKFADEQESAAYSAARALTVTGDVDDQEYAAAIAALGEEGLVELSTLVGYYATLALQLRIFRVPAPE
jgi:4-carboxymuconolactone decarboxylase